jgi:intein-encoded DNA endonuclease-like protein
MVNSVYITQDGLIHKVLDCVGSDFGRSTIITSCGIITISFCLTTNHEIKRLCKNCFDLRDIIKIVNERPN